jgi:hypothetical protein
MSWKSLRFTQSSDEVFFTASNQIVKDLCEPPLISVNTRNARRPRNLLTAPPAKRATTVKTCLSFLKNQTGRFVSAPRGGPHRVLLPFLAEDLFYLYHAHPNLASARGAREFKTLKFRRLVQNSIASHSMQGIFPKNRPRVWFAKARRTSGA